MVEMTVTFPDRLADRLEAMKAWLPTVLELSLQGFKTPAAQTASEVITFLSTEPAPQDVAGFMVSERAQARMEHLLLLNEAGLLSQAEQDELDELEQLEQWMVLMKADAGKRIRTKEA